jgi:hypothetical protein
VRFYLSDSERFISVPAGTICKLPRVNRWLSSV